MDVPGAPLWVSWMLFCEAWDLKPWQDQDVPGLYFWFIRWQAFQVERDKASKTKKAHR